MGQLRTIFAFLLLFGIFAGIALAMRYSDKIALAVPIIALGLAFALQKYVASFFGYFHILISGIYRPGDRIRIGNIKGDVRWVGLIHTTLEEVGEDEKLGGEITGRILHVPNLIILDQPVLNYSKDCSVRDKRIASDYMFDEVRIPISVDSNVNRASGLLEEILKSEDEVYLDEARRVFREGYPKFLDEAMSGTRVLVHLEPECVWIKGKFVAPVRQRNQLRSRVITRFLEEARACPDVKVT
jgi:small-conductance mechanosensitive channel